MLFRNLMAHLSLYRRYRPQRFTDVVGQRHVTETLKTALKQDRLAHALLFSGPRGTGKTSTARIVAKALNCERGGDEPCGECDSCRQITAGISLDVVEIDAASHGSVDDARDLREKVAYSPVSGRWKVYIVDECHMLSPAANNALLKVLEEPPDHVVFVFATTESHKVLQTLLDRCQRYEFRAVGAPDIAARLEWVCEQEEMTLDEQTINVMAQRAGGSVRDSLGLLEQLRSFAGDAPTSADLAQLLGGTPAELLHEAVDLISERDIGAVFVFADRIVRAGTDIREFVRGLTQHLRSLFLVQHAPAAAEILEVTDDQLSRLRAQANRFESAELLRLIDLTNETGLQLRQPVEVRLALEVGLARMTRPDLHGTPASLTARLEAIERRLGAAESTTAATLAVAANPPSTRAGAQAPPSPEPEVPAGQPSAPSIAKQPAEPPASASRLAQPAAPAARQADPAAEAPRPTVPRKAPAWRPDLKTEGRPAPARAEATTAGLPVPDDPASPRAAAAAPAPQATPEAPVPPPMAPAAAPAPESPAPPFPAAAAQAPEARPESPVPPLMEPAAPAPQATPKAAPPASDSTASEMGDLAPGEVTFDRVDRAWRLVLEKVKRRKISFQAVLLAAKPIAYSDGELTLEFGPRSRFHRDKVADPAQHGPLLEAFAEIFGTKPRLKCVLGEPAEMASLAGSGPAGNEGPGEEPDDAGPEAAPQAHDAIGLIQKAFQGTVVVEDS
jgi:DNA polymerase III subunit gamma/tau